MKRKLFTLLVAFLAIAGFQANAQSDYQTKTVLAWVATGDSITTRPNNVAPAGKPNDYYGEKWGYPKDLAYVGEANAKLTYSGGTFVYKNEKANTLAGSADRIYVYNPAVNYIAFSPNKEGTNPLTLSYDGIAYNRFVVFTSKDFTLPLVNPDSKDDAANEVAGQEFAYQNFNAGSFGGFLAVQAVGPWTDDSNLLIVVHDKDGKLSLMSFGDYITGFAKAPQYYPLYVKSNPLGGRWATPADFADCKFWQFTSSDGVITAYSAAETEAGTKIKGFSVFNVKQVDYVKNGDNFADNRNLINATFQGLDKDLGSTPSSEYFGTTDRVPGTPSKTDSVIPLFLLSTPENNCKVLSVSRQNDLRTQSQANGVYANKLEVRDYEEYFDYQNADGKYLSNKVTCTTDQEIYHKYTGLQKFAIWINEDGEMTLYPAASYSWQYGDTDSQRKAAVDNIIANSVLIYNDIHVRYIAGSLANVDKNYGVQIGWWNGNRTQGGNVTGYIGGIPNYLQSLTDYEERPLTDVCKEDDGDLSGRFYFLQVSIDTAGAWANNGAAFAANGYNYGRDYVLATQPDGDSKRLVAVPKELVRTTDTQYWRFPYDSVNMAAHWEVQAKDDGYLLINMLGDTLQYNIDFGAATPTSNDKIAGGFVPVNHFWPGAADAANAGNKYFGRPLDTGLTWDDVTHWFVKNTETSGVNIQNIWKFHKLQDPYRFGLNAKGDPYSQKSFFMELAVPSTTEYTVTLKEGDWEHGYNGSIGADVNALYWQKPILLDFADNTQLNGYTCDTKPASSCFGLLVSMEEIEYVPTHGPYYPGDRGAGNDNGIHNTNDVNFNKQDSLTAYTFLEGNYDLVEAAEVNNGLKLGAKSVLINDGSKTVNAAQLINTTETRILQFIPLNSLTGAQRTESLRKIAADDSRTDMGIDTLYGETYKWYLVKLGNDYLTFDTVNVAARTNREKVGLVFSAILENATPVRLYQPLVGDKNKDNFLIQFYMPKYTYNPNAVSPLLKSYPNTFPDIESQTATDTKPGGGEVCFATLSNESNFIYGTRAYTGLTTGTRFHWTAQETTVECASEFIDPQWLGANRLLNLPLNNQIWVESNAVNAWIATNTDKTRAIVTNNTTDIPATTLTHTYATTIRVYNYPSSNPLSAYNEADIAKVAIPHGVNVGDTTWIAGNKANAHNGGGAAGGNLSFQKDLDVPLYYIQNDEGLYLTVVPATEMRDQYSTTADVSGIRLEWQAKIPFSQSIYNNYGYDTQVVQLFAISGCKDVNDGWYGKFIYLPLASYMANYKDGSIVQTTTGRSTEQNDVFYNWNLGKGYTYYAGNDVTNCWRISQWAPVQFPQKDLVVFNSNTTTGVGSLVPIEFKLSKMEYLTPGCDNFDNLVWSEVSGKYAAFNQWIAAADDYTLSAHWKISYDATDTKLATFIPELEKVYDTAMGSGDVIQNLLTGKYYFVKEVKIGDKIGYRTIDVSGYDQENYVAKFDTLVFDCVDHKVPFFDLEKDGHFNLLNKLAILETPFKDRNLTYVVPDDKTTPTPIYSGGELVGYRTYINRINDNFDQAEYLTVWRENKRALTSRSTDDADNHIIPYYSFSITTQENGAAVDYFLNVYTNPTNGNDSVYWTKLSTDDKTKLLNWQANENFLPTYKFCLPYQVDENGVRKDSVAFGDSEYPPVYLQTLDTGIKDYPFLVVAGSSTMYVTARKLSDAIPNLTSLDWNIYTVDYRYIDKDQVTAWIFGGQVPAGQIWVPIAGAIAEGSTQGVLTGYDDVLGGGALFIEQSKKAPVNYGTVTGLGNASSLTVEFEGDTLIGAYAQRPIWYYRIQLDGKYLTDGTEIAKTDGNYYYQFYDNTWPYAYFGDKLDDYAPYVKEGITADKDFLQTFGFRYITDSSDPNQAFYVVSNADYSKNPTAEDQYRFLADINTQLVFLENYNDALVFQWGHIEDGKYTDLQVVGQGGIFGVKDGIRFLNTTGKVDIYSIDGRLIKSAELTGGEQTIPAPRGIAIVKNGSKVVKVVVK
ncbi:MAG: hypothetical protein FWF53_10215 [Candidatus Azobacteroides sp.]|nr:hypothetical protein [Candidatus Azobacteroides sp.]